MSLVHVPSNRLATAELTSTPGASRRVVLACSRRRVRAYVRSKYSREIIRGNNSAYFNAWRAAAHGPPALSRVFAQHGGYRWRSTAWHALCQFYAVISGLFRAMPGRKTSRVELLLRGLVASEVANKMRIKSFLLTYTCFRHILEITCGILDTYFEIFSCFIAKDRRKVRCIRSTMCVIVIPRDFLSRLSRRDEARRASACCQLICADWIYVVFKNYFLSTCRIIILFPRYISH